MLNHIVGTALPSIIAFLAAASEVCITDHPFSPALTSGAIKASVQESIQLPERSNLGPIVSVNAHEWGILSTDTFAQERAKCYTRIIAADCLWMPSQHHNLVRSISHFLSKESSQACALVAAGFHTGRKVVAAFFKEFPTSYITEDAVEQLSIAEIHESDMNGIRRPWKEERENEGQEEAKRWCVVAVIVRKL
jgi:EEF1A N-terminal glycine/lysine methyltransferase